jgi:dTDP-4-dehydrorhamnose 3,5-epimerase
MPISFQRTLLEGAQRVETVEHRDDRGAFAELYVRSIFARAGVETPLMQCNVTRSHRGVLRGLHYQLPPHAQAKLVSVVSGEIYDVGVDLRRASSTFGRWIAEDLSAENRKMLFFPEGIAHGYAVLSEEATVVYVTSAEYAPAYERGIRWDDPTLAIAWPVPAPLLSDRDRQLPGFREAELP